MELLAVLILLVSTSTIAKGFDDDQTDLHQFIHADNTEITKSPNKIPDMNKGESTLKPSFCRFEI
jgi:hypothetical protein